MVPTNLFNRVLQKYIIKTSKECGGCDVSNIAVLCSQKRMLVSGLILPVVVQGYLQNIF